MLIRRRNDQEVQKPKHQETSTNEKVRVTIKLVLFTLSAAIFISVFSFLLICTETWDFNNVIQNRLLWQVSIIIFSCNHLNKICIRSVHILSLCNRNLQYSILVCLIICKFSVEVLPYRSILVKIQLCPAVCIRCLLHDGLYHVSTDHDHQGLRWDLINSKKCIATRSPHDKSWP